MKKILFLDQSGNLGGAELCLLDIALLYQENCLVGLFAKGSFEEALLEHQIPVSVFNNRKLEISKDTSFWRSLGKVWQLVPIVNQVVKTVVNYELIYANTQKALVVGAIASALTNKPLVYHLHDILSVEHFSQTNRNIAVFLANNFASLIIANSQATKASFEQAGGKAELLEVVYNGFDLSKYQDLDQSRTLYRQQLNLEGRFVIGHFSRLSPWKAQHILLEALSNCPPNVVALIVGDALFGEHDYVSKLHQKIEDLQLQNRVYFLGFRSDIPQLMAACDLITHTSTAPEPFGRVIVEAMLCNRPIIASAAGGAIELVNHGETGWLVNPGDATELSQIINQCLSKPEKTLEIAQNGQIKAKQRFNSSVIENQLEQLLEQTFD